MPQWNEYPMAEIAGRHLNWYSRETEHFYVPYGAVHVLTLASTVKVQPGVPDTVRKRFIACYDKI